MVKTIQYCPLTWTRRITWELAALTEQNQDNLVHPPWATDPRQTQNMIIISAIDLCEGLNQGRDKMFYHHLLSKPQATIPILSDPLCISLYSYKNKPSDTSGKITEKQQINNKTVTYSVFLSALANDDDVAIQKPSLFMTKTPRRTIERRLLSGADCVAKHPIWLRLGKRNEIENNNNK